MSRAFVKESDNIALESPPELLQSSGPHPVTRKGYERLTEKIEALEKEFAASADESTRNRLSRDLRYWQAQRATATVMQSGDGQSVEFGSIVTIERNGRRQTIQIVGDDEAKPSSGRINWRAPLAASVMGARIGDVVQFQNHELTLDIKIIDIKPG